MTSSTLFSSPASALGPMGHGKSTYINKLLGRTARMSSGVEPCTIECEVYPWKTIANGGRGLRVLLIDTPGFDSILA
ncbi:hypothetical protein FA13DRAFT_1732554, partial [Coprinellus micaceus]